MTNIFLAGASRTPVGTFQGGLGDVPAPKLGATAISAVLQRTQLKAHDVDECIMGEVLSAGVGQAPARQAAIFAGLPPSVPCLTVNKVCGSGLKAVMLAADTIQCGHARAVIAGGQENMTLAPHLLEKSRAGYRMGPVTATDSMVKDGLWDPYNNFHMGSAAELCVREYKVSREAQDQFALESYQRAQKAQNEGWFKAEMVTVEAPAAKGTVTVTKDEEPEKARFDKIPTLRPAFDKDGSITAANASKINDGGAAVAVIAEKRMQELNLTPQARIIGYSTFAQDPKWFTTAPVGAVKKVLAQTHLKASDIDLWEINEAFSVVTLVAMQEFGLKRDQVNIHGGAVAIGHPIGASGARILATLIHALHTHKLKRGLATLCIGGGEAVAMVVERV